MPRGEVHWEDLSPEVRHRIPDACHEERRKAPRIPGTRRWQCVSCGEILHSWASCESHCDTLGHHRIELLLDDEHTPK